MIIFTRELTSFWAHRAHEINRSLIHRHAGVDRQAMTAWRDECMKFARNCSQCR